MLARIGFLVRRRLARLVRGLGSWRLSIALLVLAGLYHALLAIWATSSPPHVVHSIAGLLPFWAVWLGLLVNTGFCLWRRLPVLTAQVAGRPVMTDGPTRFDLRSGEWSADDARRHMSRRGFRVAEQDGGQLWGVRRRWTALGTYLFHGAFFLLAASLLLTSVTREESRIWVAVGERYAGVEEQILSRSAPRWITFDHFSVPFTVQSIEPEFWQGRLLFTRLEAVLTFDDGGRETTRINRPLWFGWATFIRLSGFGYAPRYEVLDPAGEVLDSAFVKMNLFPPGKRDFFKAAGLPHRIHVEALPDAAREQGGLVNRSLELRRLGFSVRVQRGKLNLAHEDVFVGEPIRFEGLTLRFPDMAYWGEFTIVRDPGIPPLFLAFLVAVIGLTMKLRGSRGEIRWSAATGGSPGRLEGWGNVEAPVELLQSEEVER